MTHPERQPVNPLGQLSERESEILKKAGERVFALSRRLADKELESEKLRAESHSLRELLAESREVRQVLTDQITSLHVELDREYEERSELRRLLASLHVQMQELLPIVTGLSRVQGSVVHQQHEPLLAPPRIHGSRTNSPLARRLFEAVGTLAGPRKQKKSARR